MDVWIAACIAAQWFVSIAACIATQWFVQMPDILQLTTFPSNLLISQIPCAYTAVFVDPSEQIMTGSDFFCLPWDKKYNMLQVRSSRLMAWNDLLLPLIFPQSFTRGVHEYGFRHYKTDVMG